MKVHLRLYTGRPDPEWYITDPATVARVRAWCQAATSPPDAPPPQPHRTGYRGYEIVDDDGRRFHIYRNRIRTPDGKVALAPGVEDELIDTNREELAARYRLDRIRPDDPLLAPIADVPAIDLQSIDGKSAPVFRPARWNDNLDVRGANTCYAYAHDTILENYVMPYRADSDMTRYAIDAALLHDGVRPLGQTIAGPPPPDTHVIAAVVQLLDDNSGDCHFFRLDSNRCWSHKPGTDPVTNEDDEGNVIRDLRQARFHTAYTLVGFYLSTPEARARLTERDLVPLLRP